VPANYNSAGSSNSYNTSWLYLLAIISSNFLYSRFVLFINYWLIGFNLIESNFWLDLHR
jgi:hypothetical protein